MSTALFYRTRDVAAMLGVQPATVRALALRGALPSPFRFTPRGGLRWPTAAIVGWLDEATGRMTETRHAIRDMVVSGELKGGEVTDGSGADSYDDVADDSAAS